MFPTPMGLLPLARTGQIPDAMQSGSHALFFPPRPPICNGAQTETMMLALIGCMNAQITTHTFVPPIRNVPTMTNRGERSHTCCGFTRSYHVGYRHDAVNFHMISECINFFSTQSAIDCVFLIVRPTHDRRMCEWPHRTCIPPYTFISRDFRKMFPLTTINGARAACACRTLWIRVIRRLVALTTGNI